MIELIIVLLILLGSIISMISAIGMIRFPDVYSRAHAATKSTTLAVLITLTGVFLYFLFVHGNMSVRLGLGIVFVFITAPVSGHILLRAAYRSKVPMAETTIKDELKPHLFPEEDKKS